MLEIKRKARPVLVVGRMLLLSAATLLLAVRPASAGCDDILLLGQNGWQTLPFAKSRCNGIWSVENHFGFHNWGDTPTQFQFQASRAKFTLTGDFNGDGYTDIAVISYTVSVALSKGDGTFQHNGVGRLDVPDEVKKQYRDFVTWSSVDGVQAVVGHFLSGNNRGAQEIALVGGPDWRSVPMLINIPFLANFVNKDAVMVLNTLGPSSGTATTNNFNQWASKAYGAKAVAMDVNLDGLDDIVLVGGKDATWGPWGSIPIAVSNGDGTFTPHNIFNYSGRELWLGTGWSAGNFAWWAATPGVTILPVREYGFSGIALVESPDWQDGDWGSIPYALALFGNPVGPYDGFWVFNDAAGNFPYLSRLARFRLAGDFDGDGNTDIALVGDPNGTTIPVALAKPFYPFNIVNSNTSGAGNWTVADFAWWATLDGVKAVTGDFNGDKKTDIALVGGYGWQTVPLALSNGDGTFTIKNEDTPVSDIGFPVFDFAQWAQSDAKPYVGEFVATGSMLGRNEPYIGPPSLTMNAKWSPDLSVCKLPCTLTLTVVPSNFQDNQITYQWGAGNPQSCAQGLLGSTVTCTLNSRGTTHVQALVVATDGHGNAWAAGYDQWVTIP